MPGVCVAALLLAGCGFSENEPGPGEVTLGEARALEDAAEMLESRPRSADAAPSGESTAAPSGE